MEATMKTETMALKAGTKVWYLRDSEDIEALHARDLERPGGALDSAGEPILHSEVGAFTLEEDTIVVVTKRSKVPWPTWTRKPKRLTEGLITPSIKPPCVAKAYARILFQR